MRQKEKGAEESQLVFNAVLHYPYAAAAVSTFRCPDVQFCAALNKRTGETVVIHNARDGAG